jgi:hypothetical protein
VEGAACEAVGFAVFNHSVVTSSQGESLLMNLGGNEAEPLRMHSQAEPGNEGKLRGGKRRTYLRPYFLSLYRSIRSLMPKMRAARVWWFPVSAMAF